MALSEIIDELERQVTAIGEGRVDGTIRCYLGGEKLGQQDAPPRVVWVPTTDDVRGAEVHYDDAVSAQASARPLAQVEETIDAHIWGKDWDEAELLRDIVVNALRATVLAAARVVRGSWPVQDGAAIAQLGRPYILTFQLLVPVQELQGDFATIRTVEETVEQTTGTP